jgi:hypothetical protein
MARLLLVARLALTESHQVFPLGVEGSDAHVSVQDVTRPPRAWNSRGELSRTKFRAARRSMNPIVAYEMIQLADSRAALI